MINPQQYLEKLFVRLPHGRSLCHCNEEIGVQSSKKFICMKIKNNLISIIQPTPMCKIEVIFCLKEY